MTSDRLYGLPGAEYLDTNPSSVYETYIEPYDKPEPGAKIEIEEWSVHPSRYHLPAAPAVLEWLEEWVQENGEIMSDFEVHFDSPGVKWAAEILLDAAAKDFTWRMANEKLASHWVTWNEDGDPLLDGEPMYQELRQSVKVRVPSEERIGVEAGSPKTAADQDAVGWNPGGTGLPAEPLHDCPGVSGYCDECAPNV